MIRMPRLRYRLIHLFALTTLVAGIAAWVAYREAERRWIDETFHRLEARGIAVHFEPDDERVEIEFFQSSAPTDEDLTLVTALAAKFSPIKYLLLHDGIITRREVVWIGTLGELEGIILFHTAFDDAAAAEFGRISDRLPVQEVTANSSLPPRNC